MKKFHDDFILSFSEYIKKRKPDFNQLLKVLRKEAPDRFTLFELFMNDGLYQRMANYDALPEDAFGRLKMRVEGFAALGYDYATVYASAFSFPTKTIHRGKSISLDEGAVISDRESFDRYQWPEPEAFDTSALDTLGGLLPDGMKLVVMGPGGVLENVMALVGYEGICYMLADDPELLEQIFEAVGSRLVRYYEQAVTYPAVGACISNDDWGFNTQTMLSVTDMKKYVIPWHKKIADVIHGAGMPAILHSCGQLDRVYDDIIDGIGYDGKHSYEDKILPVEDAYERLNPRIAVLGGLDLDFVCRRTPGEVYDRACAMLEKTKTRGGYALGSGNSIPDYVPYENYIAMIAAAVVNES